MTVIFPATNFPNRRILFGEEPVLPPAELVLTGWSHDKYAYSYDHGLILQILRLMKNYSF